MPDGWGSILVATRLEKMVSARFLQVWTDLITQGLRHLDGICPVRGYVAHRAANEAVRQLLRGNHDSIFFLDSDADIDKDFLHRFRDYEPGHAYDVLQAFYPRRGWPPRAIWIQRNALGDTQETYITDPNTIQDVAIAGTHACLIRREVFETMLGDNDPADFDWFWYERHLENSEDGNFSKAAGEMGFRVGATTAVRAGHLSEINLTWESYQEYLEFSGHKALMGRYNYLSKLIAEFTGETQEIVLAKALRAGQNVSEAWEKYPTNGPASVKAFYGDYNNGYLYDLCNWNSQPRYERMIAPMKQWTGQKILIIGAGLGSEYDYLRSRNEVDVFELPGVLRDFLRFRFGDEINILDADDVRQINGNYDLIVALDVLEHVHPDDIRGVLNKIRDLLQPAGQLYWHNNFEQQDIFPMHYDHSAIFNEWLEGMNREKITRTEPVSEPT